MTNHNIMLLGAKGQIGQALLAEPCPENWSIGAFGRAECDITNHRSMQNALHTFRPSLIINCAGMTAVDQCEKDQAQAVAANFEAPANLAAQCSALDLPLIHLSTDYVFDGRDGNVPYKPYDKMNPLSIYGNTKVMGEESIRHTLAWHVILRVSSVFSAFGNNILTKTLAMIDQKDQLAFVNDQISAPTYAPDIAKAIIVITRQILSGNSTGFGTFHYCGTPAATRYELVQAIMEEYTPMTTRRPNIAAAKTSDFTGFAERPAYSVLDCASLERLYGIPQQPWRDGVAKAMQQLMLQRKNIA